MNELDAILKDFVVESRENLDRLEHDLVELEANPSSRETLASIFRTVHTIKGAAGFTGLSKVEALAHGGETVLSKLRDGVLIINPAITSGLLALSDRLREMLSHVDRTGVEAEIDSSALVAQLLALDNGDERSAGAPIEAPADLGDPARVAQPAGSVRVNVEQLDTLMNLVGELVLARNEIIQLSGADNQSVMLGTSQRLNSITTQLQEGIMKTRMQPIDNIWTKLPRVVRDAARHCGKMVRLDMEGRETELDRTLIEAIQDPLTHVLRNAVDHGIETPERRIACGKTAEGRISLRASHDGGLVTIEVADDGDGIDVAALKQRALERGLITAEQAHGMVDHEALNLIFLPGLSTAAKITSISGRGVGMDVVKTNIERIGGRVSVHSQRGAGTTLRMRIPLTLAIMTALIVTDGRNGYAIPQANVLELVPLGSGDTPAKIERIHDASVYRLRGELLPLVWLNDALAPRAGMAPSARCDTDANQAAVIIVLQADREKFGLVLDDVFDTQEIVVKPLGRHLRNIPIFAGATITGNGRVVLILDVPGLAVQANLLADVRHGAALPVDESPDAHSEVREALLLVSGLDNSRLAIPLAQITRLEEFPRGALERVAGRDVVQYFGDVLPLVSLATLVGDRGSALEPAASNTDTVHALVHTHDGRHVGVVVNRILDTVEHMPSDFGPATRKGFSGTVVIQGRVTEIVDLSVVCGQEAFADRPVSATGVEA
jgi:two-component system chemotaxis sensor kinase CheA